MVGVGLQRVPQGPLAGVQSGGSAVGGARIRARACEAGSQENVVGVGNQAGSVADQGIGSLAPGTADRSRNGEHVPADFQGVGRP